MVINGHELVPAEIKVLDLTVVSFHRMVAVVFYVHTWLTNFDGSVCGSVLWGCVRPRHDGGGFRMGSDNSEANLSVYRYGAISKLEPPDLSIGISELLTVINVAT